VVETTTRSLQCVVVTPERAVLDETADFVSLPMYDGELGVLPGRAPLVGRLGYGELRIRRGDRTERYFIDGGFAQIRNNAVTVLTPRALRPEAIDVHVAKQALDAARTPTTTDGEMESHLKAQERARAQLRIAHGLRGETHGA
jgi:F-type H+-transporting ATPase subunit epsilon